jgi:hypothetical protein
VYFALLRFASICVLLWLFIDNLYGFIFNMDLQLPVQSVPITTKVGSLNPVNGEVYSIQQYVIKFVNDATGQWYSPVSSINKNGRHDRTEILLRVALNTINHPTILQMKNVHIKLTQ